MTASNLDKPESADVLRGRRPAVRQAPPPGRSARGRSRRVTAAGLLAGLATGLVVMLVLSPDGGRNPATGFPASTGATPAAGATGSLPASAAIPLAPRTSLGPVPTALDAAWIGYSDRSTCADWGGGDGISAVRLNDSQVAWFFSDSLLGPATSSGFSRSAGLIHNSVVIQTQRSQFVTLTGGGTCGPTVASAVVRPSAAAAAQDTRYWAEDGIKIGQTVFKFYNSYRPGNAPYTPTGTVLAAYPADQLSAAGTGPAAGGIATPQLTPLPTYVPLGADWPITWGAAVLGTGSTVYVYGTQTPNALVPDRQLYLARVPAAELTQFSAWQFYAGSGRWAASQSQARPLQPPQGSLSVSSGFSVVQAGSRYWLIQANPIAGRQDIDAYPADAPWGPFNQAAGIVLYADPGIGIDAAHDYRIMYEARVEPAFSSGSALVISYNVNSIANTTGCVPMYWFTNTVLIPRFISVPLAMLSPRPDRQADTVLTGPSDYPRIVPRDPAQWFNEWDYSSGCPPIPAITRIQAQPRAGGVTLSWPNAGIGLGYQVSVYPPGATGSTRSTTVSPVLSTTPPTITVTFSGLPPGSYVARIVPVNSKQHTGHAGLVAFTVSAG